MNKKLLSIALLIGGISYGQIGIGTDLPDQSAMLHVSSSDKGLLVPEVKLTSLTETSMINGENPAEGLIVYNTTSNEHMTKGFYYWGVDPIDPAKKQWVKVIGSLDMLSYVEENQSKASLNVIDLVEGNATQSFEFKSNENSSDTVTFSETLTALTTESKYLAKYAKVDATGNPVDFKYVEVTSESEQGDNPGEGYSYEKTIAQTSFIYKDEMGKVYTHVMDELVGSSETVTYLEFIVDYKGEDGNAPAVPVLIYTREDGEKDIVVLSGLLQSSETITSLGIADDLSGLEYVDETKKPRIVDISPLIRSPWAKVETVPSQTMPVNGDDIYTSGWMGIGYDKPSGEPNEKLRVNGSITAVNSYYADYVFESYFNGSSALKYDYKFNDLGAVESYIKTNNHLPGITPISHLEKTEEGYAFNISELSIQLLEKTEELYLHMIEQAKEIEQLKKVNTEVEFLRSENQELRSQLDRIENLLNRK